MSGLDGGLDAPVGPAGVTHRREAAVEHRAQSRGRARGDERQRQHLHEADIDLAVDGVHVAIDQSRHQGALAAVDDLGPGGLDRPLAEFLDGVALDQELIAAAKLAERRLEQFEIPEQDLRVPSVQPVLVKAPALHDHREVPALLFEAASGSCSGLPSTTIRSAKAPGFRQPSLSSMRTIWAPIVVAERMISTGYSTRARSKNSSDCATCNWPSRSVP